MADSVTTVVDVLWLGEGYGVLCQPCMDRADDNEICFVCGWNTGEYPWVRPGAD